MGITCCTRSDDPEQLENQVNKIYHPINNYVKDDIFIPSEFKIDYFTINPKPINIPENAVHLRVYASYDECAFPIWVDIGTVLTFYVYGSWFLFNGEKEITSEGITDNNTDVYNYPIGALLGHIQGGSLFEVSHKFRYTSKSQGYLMLLQNNGSYETNPFGYLDVYVTGGKIYRFNELERLSGWNYNMIDTSEEIYYLSQKEKDLLILINKLRSNPQKFAQKYLSHLAEVSLFHKQAFQYLMNLNVNRFSTGNDTDFTDKSSIYSTFSNPGILKSDINIFKIAEKHGQDLDFTGEIGHISKEGLTLEERLQSFNIESTCFSEVCSFGKACPIGILLQLITDDDDIDNTQNRDTLVNGTFTHVGISIQKHKSYSSSCVITLVKL